MRWFLLLLFCYQASSHPTSNEPTRIRRELIECCPCNGEDTLARSSQVAPTRVDDCPCRARGADSEGASSLFFPSAVRSDGTQLRSNNPNEEPKNLLEPEVGLATSVLETLREATEEEYQDALARDAARSAAEANSDESKNLVIVVEPRSEDEDVIPKASNDQDSHHIHPLGSSLNRMRTAPTGTNLLPDILQLSSLKRPNVPYRNLLDMDTDVGASNVEEVVTDAKSPLVKTPLFRSNILNMKSAENVNEDSDSSTLKLPPLLGSSKVKPLLEGLRLPLIPKLNAPGLRNTGDISPASSSNLEILDDPENKPGLPRFAKHPTLLKNLLKLKDVELIPKTDKLLKNSLFEFPKMTVPKLRTQDNEEDCNDNESSETTNLNNPEIKQTNFETKSKTEDPFVDRESEDKLGAEDCIDETNRSIDQDQDAMGSPSNIRTTTLENLDNGSSVSDDQNNNNDQSITTTNNSDFDSTPLEEQPKSTETEDSRPDNNCQDLTFSEKTVTDDGKMKNADDFDNNSIEEEETASREVLSEDQDAFTDSSNVNNAITEPFNTIESPISDNAVQDETISSVIENPSQISTNTEISPQNVEIQNDSINKNQDLKPIPSLSDTLTAIRDNIKRLDQFIKTTRNPSLNGVGENSKNNINQKDSANKSDLGSNDDDTIIIFDNDGNPDVIESKHARESDGVTLSDLQKLSDNLLDSSNQDQKLAKPELKNQQSEIKSDINNVEEKPDVVNDLGEKNSSPMVKKDRSEDGLVEITCPNNANENKVTKNSSQPKSVSQDTEPRDMTGDASESIMSMLPKVLDPLNLNDKFKSPIFETPIAQSSLNLDPLNLLKNSVVQPSLPANPLNLLNKPLDNLIKLNPTLPTLPSLDDIRDQISNVFNPNERAVDDADEDSDYDEKEIEKMAPEASTTNAQTKLPTLKPLDNLNVDLFQLGPMKSPQLDPLGSNRKLNLNSFRAKVPVPKNFELKPVKLESSIRNKDGPQRASVKLNSKRPIAKTKLPSKVNLFGSPAVKFPSLDEIRESLHRNPSTLLGNPLQHNLKLFKPSPLEDLSQNAEKTMMDIRKKFRTSLKSPKIAEPAIANPQEFLEDVGDKLKAIHYDLNDRLASVHDNLLDSTKLALPSPLLGASDKKLNKNLTPSFRTTKAKPMRLQTLASARSSQKVFPPTEPSREKTSFDHPQTKAASQNKVTKLSNQDFAASDPVPVKTLPNSEIRTPTKDTGRFPVQRLSERGPLFKSSGPKSVFRQPNFKENKVTITFEPTTTKPIMRADNSLSENKTPRINRVENVNDLESNGMSRNSKANTGVDRTSSFSEVNPWNAQQPVKFPSRSQIDDRKDTFKPRNTLNIFTPGTRINSNDKNKLKLLGTENAVLSKVKDAVKLRLANFDSLKKGNVAKADPKPIFKAINDRDRVAPTDVLRSASENVNAIAVPEYLKENVSYKCKLVCTRE